MSRVLADPSGYVPRAVSHFEYYMLKQKESLRSPRSERGGGDHDFLPSLVLALGRSHFYFGRYSPGITI